MRAKFTCNCATLANAFSVVGSVIPHRSPKPILSNAKLELRGGKAILTGTDGEISIQYEITGVVCDRTFESLLPAKRVSEILRELKRDQVTLDFIEDKVTLKCERSEFKLPTADAAEYPPVPSFGNASCFTVPGKTLREMIHRTVFATDQESTRYALGGVLFDFSIDRLSLVATDSRRLAMMSAPCTRDGEPTVPANTVVVPAKALTLLEKSVPNTDDVVSIVVSANEAMFRTTNATISTRLVEGRFPRYQDVVPKSHNVSVDLVIDPFHSAVRQSLIITSEESRGVNFRFESGLLTLSSEAADVGNSQIELPIGYDSESMTIRLDPRFLTDFLKCLEPGSQVSLKMMDEESPVLLSTEDGYHYVVMPLASEGE